MRSIHYIVGVAMLAASVTNGWAGVVLQSGSGVQSLQSGQSSAIAAGSEIASGTRVINRSVKGDATISFADGCSIVLSPGQVFTVGEASPCSFRSQEAAVGGLSTPLIIGGVVVLGGVVGLAVALSNKDKSIPLPYLSY